MIRTLRITSVLVAIGAIALLGFSVVYGIEKDPEVLALVQSEGPVAQFQQSQGRTAAQQNINAKHPLVVAAEAYAILMNPPKPKSRAPIKRGPSSKIKTSASVKLSSSTRLVGTCYNAEDPSLSFALVDMPGKGQRWVSIHDKIDHHTVGEILKGKVILLNGDKRQVLAVEKTASLSLIKGENGQLSTGATAVKAVTVKKPTSRIPGARPSLAKRPTLRPPTRSASLRSTGALTPDERARIFDRALAQAQEMQVDVPGMSAEAQEKERSRRDKVMAAILAAQDQEHPVTKRDSKQLHDLGKAFLDRQGHSDQNEP